MPMQNSIKGDFHSDLNLVNTLLKKLFTVARTLHGNVHGRHGHNVSLKWPCKNYFYDQATNNYNSGIYVHHHVYGSKYTHYDMLFL